MNFNPISHNQIMAHQNMQPALPVSRIHLTFQELSLSGYPDQNQGLIAALDQVASYLDEESMYILKITSIGLRAFLRGNLQLETKFTMRFFEFVSQKIVTNVISTGDQAKSNLIIAKGLAKRGLFDRAEMFAERLDHPESDNTSEFLGYIGKQYALHRNNPRAHQAIDKIQNFLIRRKAFIAVARSLAKKGRYPEAFGYADSILGYEKVEAYKEISREQIKKRDDALAFDNIRLLSRDPVRRVERYDLYEAIALQLAIRGDFAIALETTTLIPTEEKREQVKQQIEQMQSVGVSNPIKSGKCTGYENALEQLKKNDFKGCLDTIEALPAKQRQVEALQNLATVIYKTRVLIVL